jgi:hypothetical protein
LVEAGLEAVGEAFVSRTASAGGLGAWLDMLAQTLTV